MTFETKQEAVAELCRIVSLAYYSIGDYDKASDCFCGEGGFSGLGDEYFRNEGEAIEFVRLAVIEKLQRDGYALSPECESVWKR